MMLCEACKFVLSVVPKSSLGSWNGIKPQQFRFPESKAGWGGSHHVKPGAFLSAAQHACYICSTIFRDCNVQRRELAPLFRTFYQLRLKGNSKLSEDRYELAFTIEILRSETPTIQGQVFACAGTFKLLPKNEILNSGEMLALTDNNSPGQCEGQIRQWHNNCIEVHGRCNSAPQNSKNYPLRLLHLAQGDQVHLEVFKKNTTRPLYVTMSHCCDAAIPIKLTARTQESLTNGLSISELPPNFQDAITIARWLKIEYIWIDVLCIMQDSKEDQVSQAAIKGDIYINSHCNIAATSAEPTKGYFTMRHKSMIEPYPIANPRSTDSSLTYVLGYDDFWSNSLLDTDLHQRASFLQERLLSPRTIHFGQEQIFWECRSTMACEAYPREIPPQFCNRRTETWRVLDQILAPEVKNSTGRAFQSHGIWQNLLIHITNLRWMLGSNFTAQQQTKVYEAWSKVIERYMACNFTCDSDKLVAISGIAAKLAEITNERYLAGLWENAILPQSLLWYVIRRRQADGSPSARSASLGGEDYQAPSFSWASLNASIVWNWPSGCDKVLIKILNTRVQKSNAGALGRVSSATMELRGRLIEASLHIMNRTPNGEPEEDGRYMLQLKNHMRRHHASDGATSIRMEPTIYLDTPLMPKSTDIGTYLLPICTGWGGLPGPSATRLAGLLLKRASSSGLEVKYERIGVFGLDQTEVGILCDTPPDDFDSIESYLTAARQSSILLI